MERCSCPSNSPPLPWPRPLLHWAQAARRGHAQEGCGSAWLLGCPHREQRDPVYLRDKVTQRHSKEQFETAQKIEQEYGKYFTGGCQGPRGQGAAGVGSRDLPKSAPGFRCVYIVTGDRSRLAMMSGLPWGSALDPVTSVPIFLCVCIGSTSYRGFSVLGSLQH